jgi:hypothetical protein
VPRPPLHLKGKKFGRLTVLRRVKNSITGLARWSCICGCSDKTRRIVFQGNLTARTTRSCGCLHREMTGKAAFRHGFCKHPLYRVWSGMLKRCGNPRCLSHKNYGGRGIKVGKYWKDAGTFIRWALSHGWERGLQLERRNNDKGYNPNNCYFTTSKRQNNNRRDNRFITFKGTRRTVSEWEEYLGFRKGTLKQRILHGWDSNEALGTPTLPRGVFRKHIRAEKILPGSRRVEC